MSAPDLGENTAREWHEESRAPELWDALQLVKADAQAGIEKLEKLADTVTVAQQGAVPEPASWALMIAGLGAVGVSLRRRKLDVRFA